MQAAYEARFTREMGCTVTELRQWLPGACRNAPISWSHAGADIGLTTTVLRLTWAELPWRRIALVTLPRLSVTFDFGATPEAERHSFMKHFDLYTQRGGG